jgi:Secretion system C-terminal sorting domain
VYDYSLVNWTVNTLVYSLPGNLPTGEIPVEGKGNPNKPFPNPADALVTIPYELPDGVNTAEIQLMNGSGQVIHRYTVDRTFNELLIQTAGMPKGVFLYELKTEQRIISSGKFIHE